VAEDGNPRLRLMTFNVRYESAEDRGPRSWAERLPRIVRMLREESPDVFGIQEALHGQMADLRASLPDYTFHGAGRDDGQRGGEHTAIAWRTDRFRPDPADHGVFWLSDEPQRPGSATWGNTHPRIVCWVHLADLASGKSLYIYNSHFDHRNQLSRVKSAELLASRIAARRDPGRPVVLLGDFNAVPGNPALRRLREGTPRPNSPAEEEGLTDTFLTLHPAQRDTTTLHFWRASRTGSLKVDHILVSPGTAIHAAAIRDSDRPPVSDHFPVTAEVSFPP
jgi:endonuclease/exonuclease/phosphatase family metal-dependent hydrolase